MSGRQWKAGKPRNLRPDGSYLDSSGYVMIKINGVRVAEHRHAMETKLGRSLLSGESVHHVNGVRSDNRPENLELWVAPIRHGIRARDLICPHCLRPYSS